MCTFNLPLMTKKEGTCIIFNKKLHYIVKGIITLVQLLFLLPSAIFYAHISWILATFYGFSPWLHIFFHDLNIAFEWIKVVLTQEFKIFNVPNWIQILNNFPWTIAAWVDSLLSRESFLCSWKLYFCLKMNRESIEEFCSVSN